MTALSLRAAVRTAAALFAGCYTAVTRRMRGTQPRLDRKRLYRNRRAPRSGPRKGACPYRVLGPELPTDDSWGRLHTDPARLTQGLSSQANTR